MDHYLLCGLQTSGKTTVGKMLAESLHRTYFDTDKILESHYLEETKKALTCREIFKLEGEQKFREREGKVIDELLEMKSREPLVISLGGGTLMTDQNCKKVKKLGLLIYLNEDPQVLWKRLSLLSLPANLKADDPKKSFLDLAKKRMPIYEQEACIIINTHSRTADEILKEVLDVI